MRNIPEAGRFPAEQRDFVEDFAHMYARHGLALTVGRVWGLLLVSDDPCSLDEIAALLGVSKSGASLAARDLERFGVARRLGTKGSRRLRYLLNEEMEPIFEAAFARVRDSLARLRKGEAILLDGSARQRVRVMREFHEMWLSELEGIIRQWDLRRSGP